VGGGMDLKERKSDSNFIKGAYLTLSPLIGHHVKVTVRTGPKKELRSYVGKLIGIEEDSFMMELPSYQDGVIIGKRSVPFKLIDIHYVGSEFSDTYIIFTRWTLSHSR